MIVCPSNDLYLLLNANGPCDHKLLEIRFQKLEEQLSNVKQLEDSHTDLKKTVLAMMTGSGLPKVPIIPTPHVTAVAHLQRGRSSSVLSTKRIRSISSDTRSSDDDSEFNLPKSHKKKMERDAKRHKKATGTSYSHRLINGTPNKVPSKPFKWGKSTDAATAGFSGTVPDAFIYRCNKNTKAEVIKNHLINKGIKVKNVDLKSHVDSPSCSFKVSVETVEDFDKLITGEHIPRYVKIKEYIYFRSQSKDQWNVAREKPSSLNHPPPFTNVTASLLKEKLDELDQLPPSINMSLGSRHMISDIMMMDEVPT